jgi:hypothetical protein
MSALLAERLESILFGNSAHDEGSGSRTVRPVPIMQEAQEVADCLNRAEAVFEFQTGARFGGSFGSHTWTEL